MLIRLLNKIGLYTRSQFEEVALNPEGETWHEDPYEMLKVLEGVTPRAVRIIARTGPVSDLLDELNRAQFERLADRERFPTYDAWLEYQRAMRMSYDEGVRAGVKEATSIVSAWREGFESRRRYSEFRCK